MSHAGHALCQHYDYCGGCRFQHLPQAEYEAHKHDIVHKTIQQLQLEESIMRPLVEGKPQSRRRAEFKIRRRKKAIEIGFFEAKTHTLFDLQQCPVSVPALIEHLPAFREAFAKLKKASHLISLNITALEGGLDVVLGVNAPLPHTDRQLLKEFAQSNESLLRLTEQGEGHTQMLHDTHGVSVSFGEVEVALPVGAFLQATQLGQEAITQLVMQHLQGMARIVDLYSGCGTYSFPLLAQAKQVTVFEGADEMVAAMHNAIMKHQLEQSITANVRDLYKQPLSASELSHYDAAVINPPRNGALPQVKEIAKSAVKKLVMVSCNPTTFQRDAQYLLSNGFALSEVTPIDQFYWTNHLELVGVFVALEKGE